MMFEMEGLLDCCLYARSLLLLKSSVDAAILFKVSSHALRTEMPRCITGNVHQSDIPVSLNAVRRSALLDDRQPADAAL